MFLTINRYVNKVQLRLVFKVPFRVRTFNNKDDGNPRYLFVIIKPHANEVAQTNYQRCCHANISSITASYSSNTYQLLP